jgi:mono/diheme cytochrome c family protein
MRRLATPGAIRDQMNPVPVTAETLDEGLEHFADHCAVCHGNDGSGDTSIGRNLYPKAPDMRAAHTQALTDGELFSIIENGIRLTGMPAWGTGRPEGERVSWALVHFIRHLPAITSVEIARMEALNPKTPAEFCDEQAIRRFLAGEDPLPCAAEPPESGSSHEHD